MYHPEGIPKGEIPRVYNATCGELLGSSHMKSSKDRCLLEVVEWNVRDWFNPMTKKLPPWPFRGFDGEIVQARLSSEVAGGAGPRPPKAQGTPKANAKK